MKTTLARPSQQQIKYWYQKAKDSGFVDIEYGIDLNQISGQTQPGGGNGLSFISLTATSDTGEVYDNIEGYMELNRSIYGSDTSVWNTPQALLWQYLAREANDLPSNYKGRRFLIDFANCGVLIDAARKHNLTKQRARTLLQHFCNRLGLPRDSLFECVNPNVRESNTKTDSA